MSIFFNSSVFNMLLPAACHLTEEILFYVSGRREDSMTLESVREEICRIDYALIDLIAERQHLAAAVIGEKHQTGAPVTDPDQRTLVLNRAFEYAVTQNIDPVEVRKIFDILIAMNEERQKEYSGEGNLP
jgi:chorismate mutase